MATSWAEIIATSTMPIIEDVRWNEELALNPAGFYCSKSVMVPLAVAMLNHPPELYKALVTDMVDAEYGDMLWVSTDASKEAETIVPSDYAEYDVVSCVIREIDKFGNVSLTPYDITYDAETGSVTFPIQENAGVEYEVTFYKDGSFSFDLTPAQIRLVGVAIACVWDERFSRNWLNIQMKLKDSTFDTVNESNYIQSVQKRLLQNQQWLTSLCRAYEQEITYWDVVPKTFKTRTMI